MESISESSAIDVHLRIASGLRFFFVVVALRENTQSLISRFF